MAARKKSDTAVGYSRVSGLDILDIPTWTEHLKTLHITNGTKHEPATTGKGAVVKRLQGTALRAYDTISNVSPFIVGSKSLEIVEPLKDLNDKISLWQGGFCPCSLQLIIEAGEGTGCYASVICTLCRRYHRISSRCDCKRR